MMRWQRAGIAAVLAGVLSCAGASASAGEPARPSADTRQRVNVPPAQRNEILIEMRQMLGSIRGILYGLAADDMRMIEGAAWSSGTRQAPGPDYRREVPEGFRKFEIQTHQGFDALAEKAAAGGGQPDILKGLAALTNNCVGCHNAYRVVEGR